MDILLVEDNEESAALISGFLQKDGYRIKRAATGEDAVAFLESEGVRLLLLDLMLPGIDGFAVCAAARREGTLPIIIMSAITDKYDKLKGFELGADDYIEKPVDIDLLRVKIKALMTRAYGMPEEEVLTSGDLRIRPASMEVTLRGEVIELSVKEYELLVLLMKNVGKTLHKDYLFQAIWGADSFSENQTLTVHINRIRNKIERNPKNPEYIRTVWGVGYKLEEI